MKICVTHQSGWSAAQQFLIRQEFTAGLYGGLAKSYSMLNNDLVDLPHQTMNIWIQ